MLGNSTPYFADVAAAIFSDKPVAIPDPAAPPSGGVWAWSTAKPYEAFIVFAVGDILRSAQFKAWLLDKGYRFDCGIGTYNGESEMCFVMNARDRYAIRPWLAGQKEVLWLGPAYRTGGLGDLPRLYGHRRAFLVPVSKDGAITGNPTLKQYVGLLGHRAEKPASGDYTYIPGNGFYSILPGTGIEGSPMTDEETTPWLRDK